MEFCKEKMVYDCLSEHNFGESITAKEILPEGTKLLTVTANASCGRCEVLNNEILAEGSVKFCAILKTNEGEIKKLERTERFTISEKVHGVGAKSNLLASANAQKVKGYVEAGNLMLSCFVNIKGILFSHMENECHLSLQGEEIRVKSEETALCSLQHVQSMRFNVLQENELSPRVPEAVEILSVCPSINTREIHFSAGQLVIGGEIIFQTVYKSNDEYEPIVQITDKCEFTHIEEIKDGVNAKDVSVMLNCEEIFCDILQNAQNEARIIKYSVSVYGYAYFLEIKEYTVALDMYSIKEKINTKKEKLELCSKEEKIKTVINKHISVPLPEGKIPIARISTVSISPWVEKCALIGSKAQISAMGEVSVLYTASGTGEAEGFNTTVNFDIICENASNGEGTDALAELALNEMQATLISGNEIEIRLGLTVMVTPLIKKQSEVVSEIEIDENQDMPEFGIIIHSVQRGETLWDICKSFCADEEEIRKLNPEMNEILTPGEKIYIFRKLVV